MKSTGVRQRFGVKVPLEHDEQGTLPFQTLTKQMLQKHSLKLVTGFWQKKKDQH